MSNKSSSDILRKYIVKIENVKILNIFEIIDDFASALSLILYKRMKELYKTDPLLILIEKPKKFYEGLVAIMKDKETVSLLLDLLARRISSLKNVLVKKEDILIAFKTNNSDLVIKIFSVETEEE